MSISDLTVELSYERRPVWQWVYAIPSGFLRRFRTLRHESILFRLVAAAYLGTYRLKMDGREVDFL